MIYLASPYSHLRPEVRQERWQKVCWAAAQLIRQGHQVYSPIAHSHPIAEHGLPTDWEFWAEMDQRILSVCEELWVLQLPGWEQSRGIREEIRLARQAGKPVRFVDERLAAPAAKDGIDIPSQER